jgi:hypothetical protein
MLNKLVPFRFGLQRNLFLRNFLKKKKLNRHIFLATHQPSLTLSAISKNVFIILGQIQLLLITHL